MSHTQISKAVPTLLAIAALLLILATAGCSNTPATGDLSVASAVPAPTAVLSPTPTPLPELADVLPLCSKALHIASGECRPSAELVGEKDPNEVTCWRSGVPCSVLRGTPVPDCQGIYCYVIFDASGVQPIGPAEEVCQNDDGNWKCYVVPTVGPEATPVGKIYCRKLYCYHAPATSPNGTPLPTIAAPYGTPESFFVPNLVPKLGTIKFATMSEAKETDLLNSIAGYVLVYGYSYAVEIVDITGEEFEAALMSGKVDVVMEASKAEAGDWYASNEGKTVLDVGSAYGSGDDKRILVRADIESRAPEVVHLLQGLQPGRERIDALAASISEGRTGVRPMVAALTFLIKQEPVWTPWVPGIVAGAVRWSIEQGKNGLTDYACLPKGGDHKGYTELFVQGAISGSANCGN